MKTLFKSEEHLPPMLILEYDIKAKRDAVFNAWTELDTFKKWFCPRGFSVAKAEMKPEVGGYFKIHMKSPEGEIYPTNGEYILIERPDRIVYKDSWDDDRKSNEPVIAEVVFEALGDKTKVKLYSSFANEKQKEETLKQGVKEGWGMFLENLNQIIGN